MPGVFCADTLLLPVAGSPKFQLNVISESAGAAGVSSCGLNVTGLPKQVSVVVKSTVRAGGTHTCFEQWYPCNRAYLQSPVLPRNSCRPHNTGGVGLVPVPYW